MAIYRLPIDPEWQIHFRGVADVMAVMAYENGENTGVQAIDRETGYPMWECAVVVKLGEDRKAEIVGVRVPHPKVPEVLGQVPVFGGLEADKPAYANKRGDNVTVDSQWKFTARTVSVAGAPSTRNGSTRQAPAPEREAVTAS